MERRGPEWFERIARWADRHSPETLFARALIILVVPMLLLQAVGVWWFYSQRGDYVTNRLATAAARDIRLLVSLRAANPGDEGRERVARLARDDLALAVRFRTGIVRPAPEPGRFDIVALEMRGALQAIVGRPYAVDTGRDGEVLVEVQLADGDVLEVRLDVTRLTLGSSIAYVLAQSGLALVLFGLAIWFMRRELVPVEQLGTIANALGKGREIPDFGFEGGTREVRNTAAAFRTMRDRLRRQVQQRTEMLAGVSHDLRTPLTRMKLSLALLPEGSETRELADDVADMERMIEGYLAFARGEGDEDVQPVDIADLLQEVASAARRGGGDVAVGWQGDVQMLARPVALRRCIANLLGNALRHATRAQLHGQRSRQAIEIIIDDDGPGIPPERREDVFRPFVRLDESRNVETGGVGLGLTIARDLARSHGGDVTLGDSPLGGLRVTVRLPL